MCNWEARRVAFNHDWLKTKYLRCIRTFIKRSGQVTPNQDKLNEFCREVFPQWEAQKTIVQSLLDSFAAEMSPRTLFDKPPLNQCPEDFKTTFGEVVHTLWLYRHAVPERIAAGRHALAAVDEYYSHLAPQLSENAASDLEALRRLSPLLQNYYDACEALGEAMGLFLGVRAV
ncbi:MAG: hypothetical protein D3916_02285 [Candidatus Electrothrix sp. MAN1_4]|nr:hypothetical protein [Candidatus Electrothrix sp. MAN1_4]